MSRDAKHTYRIFGSSKTQHNDEVIYLIHALSSSKLYGAYDTHGNEVMFKLRENKTLQKFCFQQFQNANYIQQTLQQSEDVTEYTTRSFIFNGLMVYKVMIL
jgi:hypothetical protein